MSSIKINLHKLEKGIVFQIVDQNVNFKEKKITKGNINIKFVQSSHPQITILSEIKAIDRYGDYRKKPLAYTYISGKPIRELKGKTLTLIIYLRGKNKIKDDDIITIKFGDNKKRDEIYDLLKESFQGLHTN